MPASPIERVRNFSIIAHIDHGKSTLADRLLERTGSVAARDMAEQVLDSMDLERERGITIKAQAVRLVHEAPDGTAYQLNLIDTPGHVDFAYEVSRALTACEGAILVVDATQGIEAQTLANVYKALDLGLALVPVINKIDLPAAEPERVRAAIESVIGLPARDCLLVSARTGDGIDAVLAAVVDRIPAPHGDRAAPLRALIFDSKYDAFRGVMVYVRVMEGRLRAGTGITMMASQRSFTVDEVGIFRPQMTPTDELAAGEVGYLVAAIRDVRAARVGDTITGSDRPAAAPLPGYRQVTPMVWAGIYPVEGDRYPDLREALERLQLNDAALTFEPETSVALGFGFRCGFLGLLHLDIVQERLEREFDLTLITTAPSVAYRVTTRDGETLVVDNPAHLPDPAAVEVIEEPRVRSEIMVPREFLGNLMELCQERRGEFIHLEHQAGERVLLTYDLPLGEIIHDFYDQLKSRSRGYASLDYELHAYRAAHLVKLDILVGGTRVDALSAIVHREKAQAYGRRLVERLRQLIPRQLFEVAIQAAIGGRIVARETVPALRKDVLAKCYGGDITRKRKLLEKQRAGKQRMKRVGSVEIPQAAFMAVLSLDQG
ncbi:MAG TPA: translation elongation factor 4 [Candidatus Dormibacteraeota bacterium]|nr:translation elongation factor 4 [Candidatus Dormibacteraeota bacterium]